MSTENLQEIHKYLLPSSDHPVDILCAVSAKISFLSFAFTVLTDAPNWVQLSKQEIEGLACIVSEIDYATRYAYEGLKKTD